VDKRSGDITFADHGKSGKQNFGEACEQFIGRMRVGENSRDRYLHSYRTYVRGVFGDKTLAQVAQDRDGVTELLTVTMKDLSNTPRQQARLVIVGTCDEAVKAGRLVGTTSPTSRWPTTGGRAYAPTSSSLPMSRSSSLPTEGSTPRPSAP
jgi:hypothetical protein